MVFTYCVTDVKTPLNHTWQTVGEAITADARSGRADHILLTLQS